VSDVIELVGIAVTGWFTYRYLTVGPDRWAPAGARRAMTQHNSPARRGRAAPPLPLTASLPQLTPPAPPVPPHPPPPHPTAPASTPPPSDELFVAVKDFVKKVGAGGRGRQRAGVTFRAKPRLEHRTGAACRRAGPARLPRRPGPRLAPLIAPSPPPLRPQVYNFGSK
jgi:hypothetical protein